MNWIEHRALFELYTNRSVKINKTSEKSQEINFLHKSVHLIEPRGQSLVALAGFDEIYEKKFKNSYFECAAFLQETGLMKPQIRFEEGDIRILMKIKEMMVDGVLTELRQQIIDYDESLRGVSLMFFKNEKYLLDKPGLVDALKKVLCVTSFSNEKDQQYIYRLETDKPKIIVLCENLDFLTKPNKPRKFGIELWYAGGKNVNKLQFSDNRGLPIFYSCDWDNDGLFIIYPLVQQFIPSIKLLLPNGNPKSIRETEHHSIWPTGIPGHLVDVFTPNEKILIESLMQGDSWIIEESNNLLDMLGL